MIRSLGDTADDETHTVLSTGIVGNPSDIVSGLLVFRKSFSCLLFAESGHRDTKPQS